MLIGLVVVATVPRVLNLAIEPDRVYRLYGFHYGVHRTITRMTNIKFFTRIFGDSSYIVGYLRYLGYDLARATQTGSNFGTEVKHVTPYLCSFGDDTMVADGLSIINAEYSSTTFRVSRVTIGSHNFLGNRIAYPAQGRTGDDCLLATKVMVPIDGKIREGVGLLGSPSFEIPRSVERDSMFDGLKSADELRRRLAGKNKHNVVTIAMLLLVRWMYVFGLMLLTAATVDLYDSVGVSAIALDLVLTPLFTVAYFVLVERAITVFQALTPLYCSIYELSFWRRERYWKVPSEMYLQAFNGTPFKNVIWRLLGVRLGRRVFDDGCYLTERTLGAVGDDCTLNAGSVIQCHSQEDGAFKSDRTSIGAGCTLGVGAFVHYGVTMGDGSVLAPDSFLMKGEEIPERARWGGNPARDLPEDGVGRPVRRTVVPAPAPDVRLLTPGPGPRRRMSLWSPPAIWITLPVTLTVLIWAPQVASGVWAGLVGLYSEATTGILSGELARSGPAVLAAVLVVAGVALALFVLGRTIRRARRAPVGGPEPSPPASAERPAERPADRAVPRVRVVVGTVGTFLVAAVPVLLVGLLAVAGLDTRVATVGEAVLAAAAAMPPGDVLGPLSWPDAVAARQIAAIDALLSVLGPQSVVDAARTALVAVSVVGCLLLWPVARRIQLSAPSAALAVVLCGLPAPVVSSLVGSVDPGALAALWLTIAALLAGRSRGATAAAVGAVVIASLTVPLATVGILAFAAQGVLDKVFAASWPRRRARLLAVLLAAAAGYLALRTTGVWSTGAGAWIGSGRGAAPPAVLAGILAVGAVVLVLAWYRAPWLRPVVAAAAALLICAAVPGPHVTTALLLALPVVAVSTAAVIDGLTAVTRRWPRILLAAALVAGGVAAQPIVVLTSASDPDRTGLATWVDTQLDRSAGLQVDALTGAQLIRDGISADRLIRAGAPVPPGALSVVAARPGAPQLEPAAAARALMTIADGPGGGSTSVVQPGPGADRSAERREVGSRLAGNRALTLTPAATEALRSGQVDTRLATALARLTALHRLAIADFPAVPGEPADAARRIALITEVGGASTSAPAVTELVLRQLRVQRPPYQPASAAVEQGVLVVRYTTPSALDLPDR